MATLNITSALLMGLFLIAIAAAFIRLRNWEEVTAVREAESGLDLIEDAFYNPTIWTMLFVVVSLGLTMLAVAMVGGAPLPGLGLPGQGLIESAFVGAVGLVFGVFLFLGLFVAARSRGLSNAPAVAFSAIMVGVIFVTVVTINLLMAG